MLQLNQITASIRGKLFGIASPRASAIQAGFDPPISVDAVSPIMIGLVGASALSASYVGAKSSRKLIHPPGLIGFRPKL